MKHLKAGKLHLVYKKNTDDDSLWIKSCSPNKKKRFFFFRLIS